jgi:protein-disulfide isomerase
VKLSPYVRTWLASGARLILGALIVWSGIVKLSDPRAALRGVVAYDITPDWLSRGIGYGLPVLELCVGVLLIAGVITRIAAAAAGVLQIVFLIAAVEAGARGLHISSGAFSTGGVTTRPTHFILVALLNLVLIGFAALLVTWPITRISLDEFLARADHVELPSAKRLRSEQGRRKFEAELARAQAQRTVRDRYLMIGLVLPLALISFIAIGVQAKRANPAADSSANASHVTGVSVGNAGLVTVDVFEDFQSTASLAFEKSVGAELDSLAASGTEQVRYHMVAIYDASSNGNRYSSRAANAALCAADISNLDFRKYHRFLFGLNGNGTQVMPAIGSNGRTDTSLISYGKDALGIGDTDLSTFQTCVQGETHAGLVEATTQNFTNRGYTNVPVVLVNGSRLSTLTVAGLDKAVAKAAATAPKPKATTTPSATASVPATATVAPTAAASP